MSLLLHTELEKQTKSKIVQNVLLNGWIIGRMSARRLGRAPNSDDPLLYEYLVRYEAFTPDEPKQIVSTRLTHHYNDGAAALLAKCYAWAASFESNKSK